MIIEAIEAQGFRSFATRTSFAIKDLPPRGYFYVTGKNNVEPRLGRNGAGKSSIWYALLWCFFDEAPDLKATELETWTNSGRCVVNVDFRLTPTGRRYALSRRRNPRELLLFCEDVSVYGPAGKEVTQDEIEAFINMNYTSAVNSVVLPQTLSKFFDLQPSEKLAVFSEIMASDMKIWDIKSKKAEDLRKKLQIKVDALATKISKAEGSLAELEVVDYTEQSQKWKANRKEVIAEIEEEIRELVEERERAKNNIPKKEAEQTMLQNKKQVLVDDIDDIDNTITKINKQIADLRGLKESVGGLTRDLKDIESLAAGCRCPTCKQEVGSKHKASVSVEIRSKIDKIEAINAVQDKAIAVHEGDLERLRKDRKDLVNKKDKVITDLATCKPALLTYKAIVEANLDKVLSRREELEKEKAKADPYMAMMAENNAKIKTTKQNIKFDREEKLELERKLSAVTWWVQGFRRIRLLVIEEALREFELHIDRNLASLGLIDWKITLDIDKPNKDGTVKKGFSVFVQGPHNPEPVSFKCWSGGEAQRLRMAGVFGLIDFIHNRRGSDWNIEVYDEPTAWLSEEGIEDLLVLLGDRARQIGDKRLFIIDHRDFDLYGGFDGRVVVRRDAKQTQIEVA